MAELESRLSDIPKGKITVYIAGMFGVIQLQKLPLFFWLMVIMRSGVTLIPSTITFFII